MKRFPLISKSLFFLIVLMLIYSGERFLFYVYNLRIFKSFTWQEIITSFIYGMRFDFVSIVLTNGIFLIYFFLPFSWQKQKILKTVALLLFVSINFFFISFNLIDVELYQLTGKRTTFELLKLTTDIKKQAGQILFFYWYFSLLALLLAYGLYRMFLHFLTFHSHLPSYAKRKYFLELLALIVLLILGSRGGWQLKPLKPAHAFIFSSDDLGGLTLNTAFSLIKTKGNQLFTPQLEKNPETLLKDQKTAVDWPHNPTKENVVLIILESFALEFVGIANKGHGYTPFLDELAQKGLFFTHAMANGRRSIEAIPSLLSGIPSLLSDPFITSDFSSNRIEGLGQVLKRVGYSTAFFHGAENGTMYFDSFTRRVGFDHYYGLDGYPHPEDSDGHWGIYDEPFLQYAIGEMTQLPKPFASVIFTLSSHQPFSVPEKYRDRFPQGTLEIHKSIGYTDYSLRRFFAEAQKQPWFSHTLFVLTADHTTKSDQPSYQDLLGHFRVPLIFYRPQKEFPPVDTDQWVQHVDVPLSIMHLLGVRPQHWTRMGRSVFSATQVPSVINKSENGYWYLEKNTLLKWDGQGNKEYFHNNKLSRQWMPSSAEASESEYKSENKIQSSVGGRMDEILYYFIEGMKKNELLIESGK